MVLKEWGEIQKLYGTCSWRMAATVFAPTKAVCYWPLWVTSGSFVLVGYFWVFGRSVLENRALEFFVGLALLLLIGGLWVFTLETASAKAFKHEYAAHGIAQLPFWRIWKKRKYLHYALFLHGLTERGYSRDTVEKLRGFAVIAGNPEPGYRFLQHPSIVPLLTILTVLSIESIKQTDLWKTSGRWMYFICIGGLFAVIDLLLLLTQASKATDRAIQQFLQWAEHDIGEGQLLRTRRANMGPPGDPEA